MSLRFIYDKTIYFISFWLEKSPLFMIVLIEMFNELHAVSEMLIFLCVSSY